MEDSYDLMLPHWWIFKYHAGGFTDGGIIGFKSEECKNSCTRDNCNSFTIEIDDTILDLRNNPWWIAIIGNLKINDKDEMEIDWIDRIPWKYQDYQSLYNGEVSNVTQPHQSFDHSIDIQPGKEPLGSQSMLSQKKSFRYPRNTLRKCSTKERSAQASHQQVHLSSLVESFMAEVYNYV